MTTRVTRCSGCGMPTVSTGETEYQRGYRQVAEEMRERYRGPVNKAIAIIEAYAQGWAKEYLLELAGKLRDALPIERKENEVSDG